MPWLNEVHTLAHAWFGGQEAGAAIADVLFGTTNPCGRLSVTFPRRLEDTPAFLTFGKGQREIFYGEGVFIGYRYYEKLKNPPLFYFGKGLSYTTFGYSNLQVPRTVELTRNNTFDITVDICNSGNVAGYEVVQVYVADAVSTAPRPIKEFKGFSKVWIEPGNSVTARVTLDKYALSFWCENEQQWLAERGMFDVIIARSADPNDEVLRGSFELNVSLLWSGL
jgi:beta-glucosidase